MKRIKIIRIVAILFLLLFQSLFLYEIAVEQFGTELWVSIIVMFLGVLVWLVFLKIPIHHPDHVYDQWKVALWVPIGAMSCYFLSFTCHLGIVIAGGIIGTIASFIPAFNTHSNYLPQLPIAVYCGAFVGMSGPPVATGYAFIIIAGLMAGILFLLSKSLFLGIGGKLGTIAFIGVNIAAFLQYISLC